jgi:hypothetical protein
VQERQRLAIEDNVTFHVVREEVVQAGAYILIVKAIVGGRTSCAVSVVHDVSVSERMIGDPEARPFLLVIHVQGVPNDHRVTGVLAIGGMP